MVEYFKLDTNDIFFLYYIYMFMYLSFMYFYDI